VSEGARDLEGNKIKVDDVKNLLADKEGPALDTRVTTLGHVQRGGSAVAYDRILSTLQGVEAVKAVLEATPETETCFVAIIENKIVRKPLVEAVQITKSVAKAIEAQDFDKAMSLRDTEFSDQYKSYMMTTTVKLNNNMLLPPEKVSFDGYGWCRCWPEKAAWKSTGLGKLTRCRRECVSPSSTSAPQLAA